LPWRWLLCLNAVLALLLAVATRRWTLRVVAVGVLLSAVLVAAYRIQAPWWDTAADITEMSDAVDDHTGYEGSDEYVPAGADPYELKKDQALAVDSSGKPVRSENLIWTPRDKQLVLNANHPETITLRLFNYPAWEVTVNGRPVTTESADVTGLMMIPLTAGRSDIQIRFGRTPDRTWGGVVSLLCAGAVLGVWTKTRASRTGTPP
jgi:hypothetical protein